MAPQNVILRGLIEIGEGGSKKALGSIIKGLGTAFPAVAGLNQGLELTQKAFRAIGVISKEVYGSLIAQNEQLNQQIIKQASIIATNTRQFDEAGNVIADTQTELLNLQGPLRQAILDLQVETRELAGVTTAQVNESFTAVLQNYNRLIGQTKRNNGDVLQSSIELTKGVVAAIGTIGLPLQQVQQEIRAILQGDLNNPDALLAKTLNISREQFDQAKAQGELIDLLIGKLDAFVVANQLASRSIGNITVNIQDFFEQVARAAGEPLLDPIVDSLAKFQQFLFDIQDNAEVVASVVGQDFADLLDQLGGLLENLAILLQPVAELLGKVLVDALRILIKTLTGIASIVNLAAKGFVLIGQTIRKLSEQLKPLNTTLRTTLDLLKLVPQITGALADIGDASNGAFDDLIEGLEQSNEDLKTNAEEISAIQAEIARISGDDNLTELEKEDLIKAQKDLLTESLSERREIEKQIKRNELGIKAKNVEGNKELEIEKQLAIERAKELGQERADIDVRPNVLEPLGTIGEEIDKRLDNLRNRIGEEFDLNQLNKQITEFQKTSLQAFEAGLQTTEQTIADIESVVSDTRLTGEQRLGALEQINKVFKIQLEDAKQLNEIEKTRATIALQSGEISSTEQKVRLEGIKITENELKLEQAREKLRLANIAGVSRNIEQAENEISSLELQIESIQGTIQDIEFRGLQEKFKRQLDEFQTLTEQFSLERRAEIQELTSSQIETIAEIQQAQSTANRFNIEDQIKVNELTRERLDAELENASTQKDIQDIEKKILDNKVKGQKLSLDLQDEINKEVANEVALFNELFENTESFNRRNEAENALARQERLGLLIKEEESFAQRIFDSRTDLDLQRQRLDFLNDLIDSEDTRNEDRIRFLKEVDQLETQIATENLNNLNLQIQAEKQLRDIQNEAVDRSEENLTNTTNRIAELTRAQSDLQQSVGALQRGRTSRELDRVERAIEIAKQLQSEDLSNDERRALRREQRELGLGRNLRSLEKERRDILETTFKQEQAALFRRIELSQTLLKIENQRAEVAAQVAAIQAEQTALEAQSKILDLENQRNAAARRGDQESVDLLNRQIEAQTKIASLAQQSADFAQEGVQTTRLANQIEELSQLADNINQIEDFQQDSEFQAAQDRRLDFDLERPPIDTQLPDTEMISRLVDSNLKQQLEVQQRQSMQLSEMLVELQRLNQNQLNPPQQQSNGGTTINNVNTTPPDIGAFFGLIGAS